MPLSHKLSPGNVLQTSYSLEQDAIRVTLVGSGDITTPSIVQISDGVDTISSTVVGADRALDVNVVNGIELTVSHLDDSIRLGDGTSFITSTVSGAKRSIDVNLTNSPVAGTPSVSNLSMPTLNTEYSFAIAANTKKITFKARNTSKLQFTFSSGQSGTTFITVPSGSTYSLDGIISNGSLTLFVQASKSSEVLEIITWS